MFLRSVFYVSLLLPVHTYNDYLTHTALDQVPATIGDDLQIRCTKILKVNTLDEYKYSRTAHCDPEYSDTCYHVWTKDGTELSTGEKYSFKSSITFDYCETFERSTDIVKKLMLDVGEYSATCYDREMKCYSSALTIKKVEVGDLGKYQCEFGKRKIDDVQSITVYDRRSPVHVPKKVEYFEHFYTNGMKSKLLTQCVVTGGPVHWLIRLATEGCPLWADPLGNKCINNPLLALEDLHKLDTWRCYNFTIESHNAYQDQDDVTESFVYFENICRMDWGRIYCSPDLNGDVRSKGVYIVAGHPDYYYWTEYMIQVLAFILIPIVLGLFFIFGVILACSRGKVCSCCNGTFRYNHALPGTVPVNVPQQGFVPPQQGYVPPHAGHAWSAPANAPPSPGTVNT